MAVIQPRINANGKVRYRALVRLRGCPPQSKTFDRKTDAKKWAQDTESAIRDGRIFKTIEAQKHTFGEMVDRYIRQILPMKDNVRYRTQQKSQLEWWKKKLGSYLLSDVTPAKIGECRDELLNEFIYKEKKRSSATTNRYLAVISHCYTIALKEWGWVEVNPVARIKKPIEPEGRSRWLLDEERIALLNACKEINKELYLIVMLAISTGMRQDEIMSIKWKDIDFNRQQIVIPKTKNRNKRSVPIVSLAFKLLQDLNTHRNGNNESVFSSGEEKGFEAYRNQWDEALRVSEVEDFRFHDLRHTAASYLAMNSASLIEISEILGHKTLSMVKRYAHLLESYTVSVVKRMNERVFGDTCDQN